MITVWMPVYNEARDLQAAIASVLNQTHTDFELVISDNHSTDGSAAIIDAAVKQDGRVRKVMPASFGKSYVHTRFVYDEVLAKSVDTEYSIFIGGHDIWQPNLLEVLIRRASVEKNAAIVYTDSYEIDEADRVLRQYCGWVQAKEVTRCLIPQHVLLGLTHNIVFGGLWNEAKRQQIVMRGPCVGMDHFMIAEMALRGDILFEQGSAVMMRRAPDFSGGSKAYLRKHLPDSTTLTPALDFLTQLEWACDLVDRAVLGDPFASQPAAVNMLKHAMICGYAIKYRYNLEGFDGGMQAFFGNSRFQALMGTSTVAMEQFREMLLSVKAEAPVT